MGPIRVFRSRISGLGVEATRIIKRGAVILEYKGEIIDDAEAHRREDNGSQYLYWLHKDLNVDGKSRKNTARYVNHSCRPNCVYLEAPAKVFIVAKRDIHPGEELTISYGIKHWRKFIKPKGCRCGSLKHLE